MAEHRADARIDKFLRHDGGVARVGLVVLAHDLEMHPLPAKCHATGIDLVDGHARTVVVVLTQM